MIIASRFECSVGEHITDGTITDYEGKHHPVNIVIMKKATKQEWIDEAIQVGWSLTKLMLSEAWKSEYHYLISTD